MNNYLMTIKATTDFSELQAQKAVYDSLPYDQRVHCDDECIRLYGVNNDTLYNINMMYIQKQNGEESNIDIPGWFLDLISDIQNDDEIFNENSIFIEPTMDSTKLSSIITIYNSLPEYKKNKWDNECLRLYETLPSTFFYYNKTYIKKYNGEEIYDNIPGWFNNIMEDIKNENIVKESYLEESTNKSILDSNFKKKSGIDFEYLNIHDSRAQELLNQNKFYINNFKKIISKINGEIAVDREKNKLAGYIYIGSEGRNDGFIQTLEIIKEYRGYGLSSRLLKDAISKYKAVDLVVWKDNEVALNLYKKYGFVIIGYGNDKNNRDYWMKLKSKLSKDDRIMNESYIEESMSISKMKNIVTKIKNKSVAEEDKVIGNQNCMLCTWCMEAQFRNINILPRGVYNPNDIIFTLNGHDIVLNAEKIYFKNKNDVETIIKQSGNGSRFYVHINWKNSKSGHEFMVINVDDKVYVLDAQDGLVIELNNKQGLYYFNNISFENSYLVRMDNKPLNKDYLKYNDEKYIIPWDNNLLQESAIDNYKHNIKCDDLLEMYMRELDLVSISFNGTIYESAVAEDMISSLSYSTKLSTNVPNIVPYFTPEEILTFGIEPNEFIDNYMDSCPTGLYDFNYLNEYNKVKELFREYSISKDESIEKEIISLGWNPSVEPNEKNLLIAKNRLKRYIDENYELDIINLSNTIVREDVDVDIINKDLTPIYIVLSYTNTRFGNLIKYVQKCEYTHAAISFESDLKHLYSFNRQKDVEQNGLSFESIEDYKKKSDEAKLKVLTIFVNSTQKAKIRANLEYYISNKKKTKYGIVNLFRILLNRSIDDKFSLKMVCSEFVDTLLKSVNLNINDKSSNLVSPDDFDKVKDERVYIVYEGLAKEYKSKDVDRKIKSITLNRAVNYRLVDVKEAVNLLYNNRNLLLFKSIRINNEQADTILDKINDILCVQESIFTESLKPFKADDKEIEIKFPTQIEQEYQKSHKLLIEYEKLDNIEGIKSELAKLWYLNNITERRINGTLKISKDKVTKTRARILNDFKKYIKVVLKHDQDFNFTEYFNSSPYYDGSISIDNSTLKWTGKVLKNLIKPV